MKKQKLTKALLLQKTYENSSMQLKDIKKAVDGFLRVMTDSLSEDCDIELRGLGRFSIVTVKQRKVYNFQKKTSAVIPGKKVIRFKPSAELVKKLNHDEENPLSEIFDDNGVSHA